MWSTYHMLKIKNLLSVLPQSQTFIQSGLNTSESFILTNSNNDSEFVGTNFINVIINRYNGKFVFRLRRNKIGNQTCYLLYNQYPLI